MIQSVIFDKKYYKLHDAKKWLSSHHFKTDLDEKPLHYRFRQVRPNKVKYHYITKTITKGIKFIIGFPK